MPDDNAVELIKRGSARFARRASLDTLRQEIALNFAPQHASWTTQQELGDDFAAHLVDGTPLIIAEDYVGQIGAMLRPAGRQWFWHRTAHESVNEDPEVRDYLDWRSRQLMRLLFERSTGAEGALTEADQFYGLFGDAVLSIDYATHERRSLVIQHHHSKDATWEVGKDNRADVITRREIMPARVIMARFSQQGLDKPLHHSIKEACEKDGSRTFEIRHEVLPASEYDAYIKPRSRARKDGYVSVWVDVTNAQIIRETHTETFRYVIPRAARRYGYPYGISRATLIALPDSRLIQQQALAILEAAERQVNPPIIAASETFRGTPQLKPFSINYYDRSYDARTGPPLAPLELAKNFRLGVDALLRTEAQIARAFRLDRIRFPDTRNSKTTEEAQFLINEFVRAAVPMFAPMKSEYSDELLYEADRLVQQANGYADRDAPEALKSMDPQEMVFAWENPLTDMMERQTTQRIAEIATVAQTIAGVEAAASQVQALAQVDTDAMFRSGVVSLGGSQWLLSEARLKAKQAALAQAQQMQQMVAAAPNVAQAIDSGVSAAAAASEITLMAEPGMPLLPAPV